MSNEVAASLAQMRRKHFLVVDDDAESRDTVLSYLRAVGCDRLTECPNGEAALRALESDPSIDFIISDWDMPIMNGLALLQAVKGDPERAGTPFLIMTSPVSEEASKVLLAGGSLVDGYLIKPFRMQVLMERIDKILRKGKS